eukprot:GHVP01025724.1.p1 GENE.GHVP01025724.1~~GHVP01025724.1.p1  ORF type:complete len:390 (+),score=51.96 GHVP01025724.1:472-1641(+)
MNCGVGSRSSSNSADSFNKLILELQACPIEGRGVSELGGTPSVATLSSFSHSWENNSTPDFKNSDLDSESFHMTEFQSRKNSTEKLFDQNRRSLELSESKFLQQAFPTRLRRGAEYPARRISPLKFPSSRQPFRKQRRGGQFPARSSSLSLKCSFTPPLGGQTNDLYSADFNPKKSNPFETASRIVPRKSTLLLGFVSTPAAAIKAPRNRPTSQVIDRTRMSETLGESQIKPKVQTGPFLLSVTSETARIMLTFDVGMHSLKVWAEELEKIQDAYDMEVMSGGCSAKSEVPFAAPGIPIVVTLRGLKRNTPYELKMNANNFSSKIWIFRTLSNEVHLNDPFEQSKIAYVSKDRIIYHPNCQPTFLSKSPLKNLHENVLQGNVFAINHFY